MDEKDKQLLLKDLCARIPYDVVVNDGNEIDTLKAYMLDDLMFIDEAIIKPYLRPMSSMTREEKLVYEQRLHDVGRSIDVIDADDVVSHIDWLLSHHFDFRGLIPMGLALEAKEGMYKTE